jgi:hypothetical protein
MEMISGGRLLSEVAMGSDIEMPQPANPIPLPPIDYDHFRAIASIERRKAIAAFPGSVRRWMKSIF